MSRNVWWLDFVENELDSQTQTQMKALLKRSPQDQEKVKSLLDTKKTLKEHDSEILISEEKLDALHDRIMAKVADSVMRPPRSRYFLKRNLRQCLKNKAFMMASPLLAVAVSILVPSRNISLSQAGDSLPLDRQTSENSHEFRQLMTHRAATELYLDIASQDLDQFNSKQLERPLRSKKIR